MWVFDFEVFVKDWMVVFKNMATSKSFEFVNDQKGLADFYEKHKEDLFIGFNNKKYDDYIFKGILLGENPKRINDILIEESDILKIWRMYDMNKYQLYSLDISQDAMFASLKELEGWFQLDIMESSVPFDIDRALTQEEIDDVIHYCRHDVDATLHIVKQLIGNVKTKLNLVQTFGLNKSDLKRTNAQLTAKILGANKINKYDDEFTPYEMPPGMEVANQEIVDFYTNPEGGKLDYDRKLQIDIAGVEHTLAYGGLHGARKNFKYEGEMWMLDGASYYPSMMIAYDFLSRGIPENMRHKFKEIYDTRFKLKAKGDPNQEIYKLILNTIYGCLKNVYNGLYDPKMSNNVCITGQMLLIDLIEKIEPYATLVQSNTDGILVIPHNKAKIKEAVKDWEKRTGLPMDIDIFKSLYQKDVNNYIMVDEYGELTVIGGMVRQTSFQKNKRTLRNSNSILDDAVVNYFVNKVRPEQTIADNNDLSKYQIITKTGNTFDKTIWRYSGMEIEAQKVNRVYATKDRLAGKLYKIKDGDSYHAIASLPDNCYLDNRNEFSITKLDKNWYVEAAWDRIKMFDKEAVR